MENDTAYISEFEELLKIREFSKNSKLRIPFLCTYELISKALKEEYQESIDEKIKRWVASTHIPYFKDVEPVPFYLQAKMLYRDGFYEASIILLRSVCEMICYDLLSKKPHPFGNIDALEAPMYRAFVNFLAIPKKIERKVFEDCILTKVNNSDDEKLITSSYSLDKSSNTYHFNTSFGQKKNNLRRILNIFKDANFEKFENFSADTFHYLHRVYDVGNIYVHTKKRESSSKEDAFDCVNMLTHILSDIYGVTKLKKNTMIKSGYSDFPDICKGMNFSISFATSLKDAQRVYYNLPDQEQINTLMEKAGVWNGEWKDKNGKNQMGDLTLSIISREHMDAYLQYHEESEKGNFEPLEIRLFGNYFHLLGFDEKDKKHKTGEHVYFELEFFNDKLLLGHNVEYPGKVIFQRQPSSSSR